MSLRQHLRLHVADGDLLRAGFEQIRTELGVPQGFPPQVLAEAEAVARAPRLPSYDRTDIPLLTIDPPGSMDLDQALHVERRGHGYRVHYAIADVAAFVRPGGALDREAHARGLTLYAPDLRTPLHPPQLSEGAASLLPGQVRPALLWTLDLDRQGELTGTLVRRALVRSRQRWDYDTVQARLDAGTAEETLQLFREVGRLREERERERGGVSLPIPEQEVVEHGDGFALALRVVLGADGWNAQLSLLTGMAGAQLMLDAGVGVVRTLPPPPDEAVRRLRRAAAALGVAWAPDTSYAEVVRDLDPTQPAQAALVQEATALLRGAGYTVLDGPPAERGGDQPADQAAGEHAEQAADQPAHETGDQPARQLAHSAVAAPYAHVTAPLRRLVDRYAGEVCRALCAGEPVPDDVRAALPTLPSEMAEADRRAGALERECVNLVEAVVLSGQDGTTYEAAVVDVDGKGGGVVQLRDPAVRGRCEGDPPLGERVRVRLVEADPARRTVRFALA